MNPVALGIGVGLFVSSLVTLIYAHRNFSMSTTYEEAFGKRIK